MADFYPCKLDEGRLSAQLKRGHWWLRFEPELERFFRVDYFRRGLPFRIALLLLGAALIGVTPLYDGWLLQAPPAYNATARFLQFGVMIPALMLALVISLSSVFRRFSGFATMAASLVVGLGMLGQRAAGVQHDFDMPLEFTGLVIAASFLIARFRFWFYLPAALALLLAAMAVEIWIVQPQPDGWYHLMSTAMLVLIGGVAAYSLEHVIRAAWLHEYMLRKWSTQDPLTGLLNRRAFFVAAERALRQAARDQICIGVAMIDLDEFKRYNDYYGHQAGDACLQQVARIIDQNARRPLDCCGRYGGEEFVVMWFGASAGKVEAFADQLRQQIRDAAIPHRDSSVADVVTLSVGVAVGVPAGDVSIGALIEQADRALYQAKLGGRDQWVASQVGFDAREAGMALA